MLQSQVNIKQPLGVPGNVSQQQNSYFNIFGAICADDKVQVGYFVQKGVNDNEVVGVKGNSVSEIIGLAIFDRLQSGYDLNSAMRGKGDNVTILNVGNVFIETELKCDSGDYVCVNADNGDLVIDSAVPTNAAFTGFRVLKGNASATKGVIEITTAGVAGVSTGSGGGGGGISPTLFYTKAQINAILAKRDLTKYYTKTEANALLLQKVDSATLGNYEKVTDNDNKLAKKADLDTLQSDYYTKAQVDLQHTNLVKDIYNKSEISNLLAVKADKTTLESDYTKLTDHNTLKGKVTTIESKIPTDASATNQLTSKDYVDNAIKTNAARAISSDKDGNGFASLTALKAGPWYNMGISTTPTINDYAVVKKDATHSNNDVRYNYDGAGWVFFQEFSGGGWSPTTTQQNAIDSGITGAKVAQIETNKDDIEKRVKKAGDTMTGQLSIELSGTGDLLKMKAGDKGVLFSLDSTLGVMGIVPESHPTTGFEVSYNSLKPRTSAVNYQLGDNSNYFTYGFIKYLNNIAVENFLTTNDITRESLTTLKNQVTTNKNDITQRVQKTGDTMTGELKIELPGSGDMIKLQAGDKGASFMMDSTTGYVHIVPVSAPTTGFEISANTLMPRTNAIPYNLGGQENTWDNGYIENLKEVKTLNGTDITELVVSVAQVKQLIIDLEHPIGSVIHSFDYGYDPNNVYTGTTWEKIKEGIFLEATETTAGTEKEAGLPNITGNFGSINQETDGCFNSSLQYSELTMAISREYVFRYTINSFDASRSSAVYGKSTTVQPHSITCFIWRRIA